VTLLSRREFALTLAGLATALACSDDDGGSRSRGEGAGAPRPFELGLSSVPQNPTDESYRLAFEFAASAGEVILVQRAPPWPEFVPGGQISERTERLTRFERDLAREFDLRLFLAIDPTDPADRGRLAGLPDNLRGRDFSDGNVRSAFISYAKYLALNYKPAYLALGVEVDMFFNRRGDAAFRNFQSLYFEAYDAVKSVSPNTVAFPTFQYENVQGLLLTGEPTQPTWALVPRFEPKIDAVAVSSFPGFTYGSIERLPADYYASLRARFDKPLILASIGWTSGPSTDGGASLETEQATFIRRTMTEAETLGVQLVVWYLGQDVQEGPLPQFAPLSTMGLYRADGGPKASWLIWQAYSQRPIER
jgi:hypothetical protein